MSEQAQGNINERMDPEATSGADLRELGQAPLPTFLVLTGTAVLTWLLAYPFYGPLLNALFGSRGPFLGHAFALAQAAGFLALGLCPAAPRRSTLARAAAFWTGGRHGATVAGFTAAALGLGAAAAGSFGGEAIFAQTAAALGYAAAAGAGLASAPIMLRWLAYLGRACRREVWSEERGPYPPEVVLAAAVFLANGGLWLIALVARPAGPIPAWALLLALSVGLVAAAGLLSVTGQAPAPIRLPEPPEPADGARGRPTASPVARGEEGAAAVGEEAAPGGGGAALPLSVLALFALAAYPAGGLLYRLLGPAIPLEISAALGYWPYMAALWPFALLGTPLAAAQGSLLLIGLGLILRLTAPTGDNDAVVSSALVQTGLAGADIFYIGQAARHAAAGLHRAALALAVNVLAVAASGVLLDAFGLSATPKATWAVGFALAAAYLTIAPLARAIAVRLHQPPAAGAPFQTAAPVDTDPEAGVQERGRRVHEPGRPTTAPAADPGGARPIRTLKAEYDGAGLTPTERAVAELLLAGHTYRAIADRLYMSVNTVKFHVKNIYTKLGVASRHEFLLRYGIPQPAEEKQA